MTIETLELLAKRNWRGISTLDMVCEIQHERDWLRCNPDTHEDELTYHALVVEDIQKELLRRRSSATEAHHIDAEVIQTIKGKQLFFWEHST